jgi:hypothetical protein
MRFEPEAFISSIRLIRRSSTKGPFLLDLLNLWNLQFLFYERSEVQASPR